MIVPESLAAGLRSAALALSLPPVPLLGLILLAWLLRQRALIWARLMLFVGLAGLWLCATEVGATAVARLLLGPLPSALQWPLPAPALAGAALPTVIVVLGGGARQDVAEFGTGWLKPLSIERLNYGAWLARQTGLPLAFTGGPARSAQAGDKTEAALADAYVRDMLGMRLQWLESQARDTRENARFSADLLKPTGVGRVLLVTHALHMPRALHHFRLAFGEQVTIVAAPVGARASDTPFTLQDWLPSNDGLTDTRYAVYEWLAERAGH